jgi:hypothetical protein
LIWIKESCNPAGLLDAREGSLHFRRAQPAFAKASQSLRERRLVGGRGIEPLTPSMSMTYTGFREPPTLGALYLNLRKNINVINRFWVTPKDVDGTLIDNRVN